MESSCRERGTKKNSVLVAKFVGDISLTCLQRPHQRCFLCSMRRFRKMHGPFLS